MSKRKLLSAAELASYLGVSKQTVLRAYKRGELTNKGLSTSPRFDLNELNKE